MSIRNRGRRVLSALATGAAALLLAVGGVSVAHASPVIMPDQDSGSVTVHKHEQDVSAGQVADGREKEVATANIAGVTFTAQQIESVTVGADTHDIDLSTNEGWLVAAQLVRDDLGNWTYAGQPATVNMNATVYTENTGPEGGTYEDAVFADLPIGLYLFTETEAPAGVTMSAPWVLSVPLTDPIGDATQDIGPNERWNYDIHVYPKNSTTAVTKEVNDENATSIGDAISWTIRGEIPLVANPDFDTETAVSDENLLFFAPTAYVVKDDLDIRLTPAATNPVVVSLVEFDAAADAWVPFADVTLDAGDYTIDWANPTPAVAGSELTLSFTEAGLNKLGLAVSQAANPAAVSVQVVLTTLITSLNNAADPEDPTNGTIGDGIIANQAELFPNENSVDTETPVVSNEPETRWGDIIIEKRDATDGANLLAGAEFQVFASEEEALNQVAPITINGQSVFTTEEDGQVLISGLRYSNWENGETIADEADYKQYWIVETKSPEGFELLAEPIMVYVTAAQQDVDVTQIDNVPTNSGFALPLTGGTGTTFLTIGGIVILAAVLLFARRRSANSAE